MMLDTADNKIYFPRFYDIDTICSYDNSGQLKFDVDIEMEQGYWNTSSSRLWTRIRDLMHNDIVTTYNNMRQNGVSYENMMHYIYDEQIAKIPQTYYNKDYDVKYAPFADSYIGMAHGDTYEHVKRWLKQRFTFVDTLFDYAPSYNNDVLTIRANTTELMTLEIETYTPVYQHVSWYNGQMDKKKIDGKVSVEFSGTAQAATDQEVLIYGGSNVKSIKGITSMNPNRMLIGSATKLVEIDAHDCPLLADINANKANLSPHEYLNKVNLSNCPLLEGNLRLNNSPLVQEINIKGTNITGMNLPSSIRNLQTLRLPNTMTDLTLNDASMLHTLEFDEGVNLQSVSMTNCNALENVIGFDLLQTPSITLNNSYNNVAELYFRDTTNLSLSNMNNLERVIFTPNAEYETFELINLANAPDYKVTTFNCPKLSTFMTTAPYRESYNNCGMKYKEGSTFYNLGLPEDIVFKNNYFISKETGLFKEGSNDYSSSEFFIEVTPGVTYKLEFESQVVNGQIVFYKTNNANDYVQVEGVSHISITSKSIEFTVPSEYKYIRIQAPCLDVSADNTIFGAFLVTPNQVKDYGDIQPNTTFTANSIDISSTQFTDVKLLCTTDTNTLKLPTTVKNFYCDSSFDLDTDYLEDGEYDVVHGELVEPYTTDYEGEVLLDDVIECRYSRGEIEYTVVQGSDYKTDKIPIENAYKLDVFFEVHSQWQGVEFLDKDENKLSEYSRHSEAFTIEVPSDAKWMIIYANNGINMKQCYRLYSKIIPNLIPSSADGSLIFSMYAPSNAVAPASGTWDLHGLEFDNFHTFGMNNDVAGGYTVKKDITDINTSTSYYSTDVSSDADAIKMMFDYKGHSVSSSNITNSHYLCNIYIRINGVVYDYNFYNKGMLLEDDNNIIQSFSMNTKTYQMEFYATKESLSISIYSNSVLIEQYNLVGIGKSTSSTTNYISIKHTPSNVREQLISNPVLTSETKLPLTMPARYDDYNITIKNANISPKTHNTMLYPLLVNEDNPITGTLDYTNYAGKHLSWSFAYTDEEYVDIIQPKEELINSYEYRYNAFYQTDYEFDNPYEVARYTSSASGVLPGFNTEFTYTYDEKDNGDGTYTIKIYADSLDNLPTRMKFNYSDVIEILKWNTSNVTDMSQMFYGCNQLEKINNIESLVTSNVTDISKMFYNCKVSSLDLSEWDTSNVTNMEWLFRGCANLTDLDVSGFDTANVTNMANMFAGCNKLTSLDVSGFDTSNVTDMSYMFGDCSKLKTITGLGDLDISNVTIIDYMFINDSALETWGLDKWDTSKIETMAQTFRASSICNDSGIENWKLPNLKALYFTFAACKNLTRLDISGWVTENTNDINLEATFYTNDKIEYINFENWSHIKFTKLSTTFSGCCALTEIKGIENFDTSKVTHMGAMLQKCENLTSLDFSGFDTSKVTNMQNMFKNCSNLISLNLSNWPSDKVNTIIPQLSASPSTSILYGTVVIDESTLPSGWIYKFDDVNVFLQFTASVNSTSLVTFNTSFTEYDVSVISLENNLYQYTYQYTGSNKPTSMTFYSSSETSYSYAIKSIEKLVLTNASHMANMFRECSGLTSIDLSRISISSSVDSMASMFRACTNLTKIIGLISLDTSNVTNMSNMFNGCSKLPSLDLRGFDTSNVISMSSMFANCRNLTSLDLSGFDTSKVTTMNSMFYNCSKLTSLDLSGFDTKNVTDMINMFNNCNSLTSLNLNGFDTSKVTNMSSMFYSCNSLTSLNLSKFNTWRVITMNSMFFSCNKLIELDSMQNISVNLDLSSTLLDATSLLDVIDNLVTVSTTKTLTLGSTLLAKLTEDQIAIAVNKGWTVS